MVNQFLHNIQQNRRSWSVCIGALFLIQVGIVTFMNLAGASLPGGMGQLFGLVPDEMKVFVGSSGLNLMSVGGRLAVAYNHPLTKVTLVALAVMLPAAALAGELERGTLDLLLARPLRRYQLVLSSGLSLLLATFAAGGAMLLGTLVGAVVSGVVGAVPWGEFVWLAFSAIALMLAMSGLAYLFSALARRSSQALAWAAGLIAGMFFLEWFASMWAPVQMLTPLGLFHYYQPGSMIGGAAADWWLNVVVLLTVAAVSFAAAIIIFERRDLLR